MSSVDSRCRSNSGPLPYASAIEMGDIERRSSDLAARLCRIHEAFEATIPNRKRSDGHRPGLRSNLLRWSTGSGGLDGAQRLRSQSAPEHPTELFRHSSDFNEDCLRRRLAPTSRVFDVENLCLPGMVFHPLASSRLRWDLFILILALIVAFYVPFRIAFQVNNTALFIIDRMFDAIFFIDILVNFNTGYRDHDVVVIDRTLIVHNYLFGWFIIDLVATIPFYLIFDYSSSNLVTSSSQVFRLSKVFRLFRLLRLFRARRVLLNIRESLRFGYVMERLSKLILSAILVAHLSACAFHFIGIYEQSNGLENWIDIEGLSNIAVPEMYITCVYWAMATMTTVGYGDILSYTFMERVFTLVVIVFGAGTFAYVVTNVVRFIGNSSPLKKEFQMKMDRVNDFLKFRQLPSDLSDRIRLYHQLAWKGTAPELRYEKEILDELPNSIRSMVAMEISKKLVTASPMFLGADPEFSLELTLVMQQVCTPPGEFIFVEGEAGDDMYLIMSGEAEVLQHGWVTQELKAGHYFGAAGLMGASSIRKSSVRSKTWMNLRLLKQKDLLETMWKFPLLRASVIDGYEAPTSSIQHFFVDESSDLSIQKPLVQLLSENCENLRNRVFNTFMFAPASKRAADGTSRIAGAFDMAALQSTLLRLEFSQCVEIVSKLKQRISWLERRPATSFPPSTTNFSQSKQQTPLDSKDEKPSPSKYF